jgi:hypothetical protein
MSDSNFVSSLNRTSIIFLGDEMYRYLFDFMISSSKSALPCAVLAITNTCLSAHHRLRRTRYPAREWSGLFEDTSSRLRILRTSFGSGSGGIAPSAVIWATLCPWTWNPPFCPPNIVCLTQTTDPTLMLYHTTPLFHYRSQHTWMYHTTYNTLINVGTPSAELCRQQRP